ncbi:MAG: rRNA pseudouridine synthase [Lachnospiraceae bacterium]|nr:rRNA pseudouridine synthase [Lachnospiraceae bacterium]
MRLNRILAQSGLCSRRQADRYIEEGRVTVNGRTAVTGQPADPDTDEILFDGKRISDRPERIVIAFNKPPGIVCSTVSQGRNKNDIISAIGLEERLFPVGRLDKDSTGLILLTNDGDLTDRVLRSKNGHEKEYLFRIRGEFSDEEINMIRAGGIALVENRRTKPCRIQRRGKGEYDIILTEGMNRQIRRLCEYFGKEITKLCRIRFMNITLDGLDEGQYRYLTKEEKDGLYKSI